MMPERPLARHGCVMRHRAHILPTRVPIYSHRFPPLPRDIRGMKQRQASVTNHDFFSGSGSSYVIGKAEATEDEDWDF